MKKRSSLGVFRCVVVIVVVTFIIVAVGSNNSSVPSQSSREPGNTQAPGPVVPGKPEASATEIPANITYSIIDSSVKSGIKRTLNIRLNQKVSEGTLRAIALKLKSQDVRYYDRTFMTYYLPGMAVGAGAWATTHFDPDLEVRILGLTAEEEEKLVAEAAPPNREIIGCWLDESPIIASRITIFREDTKLFIERKFKDGSTFKKEIVARPSTVGKRFEDKEANDSGEFDLIDSQGNLQLWSQNGLITTAKAIGR